MVVFSIKCSFFFFFQFLKSVVCFVTALLPYSNIMYIDM